MKGQNPRGQIGCNNGNLCHVWTSDKSPTRISYTETGDVSGSIEVRMEGKPTGPTSIIRTLSVSLSDFTTPGALLTGVSCININYGLTNRFCFIFYEPLELSICPTTQLAIEPSAFTTLLDSSQFLQGDAIERLVNNPLAYTMVDIRHKPFLPSLEFLKFSLCGPGAFASQPASQVLILSFDVPDLLGIEKFIIAQYCMIDDSCINPQHSIGCSLGWCCFFHSKIYNDVLTIPLNITVSAFPVNVFLEVFGDCERYLDSTFYGGNRDVTLTQFGCEGILTISDGTELSFSWEFHESDPLEDIRSSISCITQEFGLNSRIDLPQWEVSEVVEFDFIEHLVLKPYQENLISYFINNRDCVNKRLVLFESEFNSPLHENFISFYDIYNLL